MSLHPLIRPAVPCRWHGRNANRQPWPRWTARTANPAPARPGLRRSHVRRDRRNARRTSAPGSRRGGPAATRCDRGFVAGFAMLPETPRRTSGRRMTSGRFPCRGSDAKPGPRRGDSRAAAGSYRPAGFASVPGTGVSMSCPGFSAAGSVRRGGLQAPRSSHGPRPVARTAPGSARPYSSWLRRVRSGGVTQRLESTRRNRVKGIVTCA